MSATDAIQLHVREVLASLINVAGLPAVQGVVGEFAAAIAKQQREQIERNVAEQRAAWDARVKAGTADWGEAGVITSKSILFGVTPIDGAPAMVPAAETDGVGKQLPCEVTFRGVAVQVVAAYEPVTDPPKGAAPPDARSIASARKAGRKGRR